MPKKCLPCLVHGEYIPLEKLVSPLVKKRMATEKRADNNDGKLTNRQCDEIIDNAWDDFNEALDKLKIGSVPYDSMDEIDLEEGIYEFYLDSDDIYYRKRKR